VHVRPALFGISCLMNAYMDASTGYDQLMVTQVIRALGQPFVMLTLSNFAMNGHPAEGHAVGLEPVQHDPQPGRLGRHRAAGDRPDQPRALPLGAHGRIGDDASRPPRRNAWMR
jgi:hypothetical protein